jgi:hypothetical protein
MAADRYAPTGQVWLCMMCGKTTKDCYGEERGWDESCALNCILVDEATKWPTEAQAVEFAAERERRLEECRRRSADLIKSINDGTYKPDPELLELARQIIRQQAAAAVSQEKP